ncbi:MAG: hypothetical protein AAF317_18460 [Pseudomonadota bacterium]
MRVGFLLNHDAPHQVPHIAPHAFALSRARPGWDVRLMCSTQAEVDFATEIGTLYEAHHCLIERLHVPLWARAVDPVVRHFAFLRKHAVQEANLARFARFDALVVPEMTSLRLKAHAAMSGVKMIFTNHGAGDGYNQFGTFDPRFDDFDLVLLAGPHIARELIAKGRLISTPYALIGYAKFEIAALARARPRFFDNDRPTVLYNPTQNPDGSSWHRFGPQVLEYFLASDDYNLIFAPHVLLFTRSLTRGARLPGWARSSDTVLIDRGSRASVDMTYQTAADLYLGDMSSQIYEFIATPRPAVFLDPFGPVSAIDRNFRSWTFGPVIEDVGQLGKTLETAFSGFDTYRPVQEAACIFAKTPRMLDD